MLYDDFDFDDDDGSDYDDGPYPPKTDQGDYCSGDSFLYGLFLSLFLIVLILMSIFGV